MPKYKLTYFDIRARGEGIRWVLTQAGVDYEDARVEMEQWPSLKADMPFGQLPVLDFDGKRLGQSLTIARYLANQFGLAGKNDWEKALADQYVDGMEDMYKGVTTFFWEEDEKTKLTARKKFVDEIAPTMLPKFEKFLSSNPSGFLVGDSLTWADLYFGVYMENFESRANPEFGALLEKHPKIKENLARIRSLPKIADWIKNRPVNPY